MEIRKTQQRRIAGVMVLVFCALQHFNLVWAQNNAMLEGRLAALSNQSISLTGFNGLQASVLDSTKILPNGSFVLRYPAGYTGMAILTAGPQQSHVLVLEPGGVQLQGNNLSDKTAIHITKGLQNQWFEQYATEHPRRELALSAWDYLRNLYQTDPLFRQHGAPAAAIMQEKARINSEDSTFLANLPAESYIRWYLPYRGLVSSVQALAQYRTNEIPAAIAAFRAIDFSDPKWLTSGIMRDAIEKHVWLIENSAGPIDSVYASLRQSTDILVSKLKGQPAILTIVTDYLFDYLEERSLFAAAEYLALTLLNDNGCELGGNLTNKLEAYRKMKRGNIAPDIYFGANTIYPTGSEVTNRLSALKSKYKLVLFAAGWCPHCTEMMPQVAAKYQSWKKQGVEVVLVSLDENANSFMKFAGSLPFLRTSDFQKWETKAAKDYHVYSTPTMYLLNEELEILLKPNSVAQMDAWIDWVLVKGNK